MKNTKNHKLSPVNQSVQFEDFYKKNFSKVRLTLVFMGVDDETANDLSQEAFTRLWSSWSNFDNEGSKMKFLKVVSRNLWIDKYRKIKREHSFASHTEADISLQESIDYHDLIEAIKKALQSYDNTKKDMFFAIKLHGVPYKEVADKFNVNVKTLERYMTQMSKSVRTFLEKHYPHISSILLIYLKHFN